MLIITLVDMCWYMYMSICKKQHYWAVSKMSGT